MSVDQGNVLLQVVVLNKSYDEIGDSISGNRVDQGKGIILQLPQKQDNGDPHQTGDQKINDALQDESQSVYLEDKGHACKSCPDQAVQQDINVGGDHRCGEESHILRRHGDKGTDKDPVAHNVDGQIDKQCCEGGDGKAFSTSFYECIHYFSSFMSRFLILVTFRREA